MKFLLLGIFTATLVGCVSGAPKLTQQQADKLESIKVYKKGESPNKEYTVIDSVSGADCSGPGGTRLYGQEGKAIDVLLKKSASLNADALVNVSCGSAPFVNNCWAAKKCSGEAVKFK
jgi:hypothetical protein